MNLKDSFRYMNHINEMLEAADISLYDTQLLTTTKEMHLKHAANADAEDEVIEDALPSNKPYTANDVLKTIDVLIEEMEIVSKAIADAKRTTVIDIDYSVAMNKKRQHEIKTLTAMAGMKPQETKSRGTDYKFNNDGNQTQYYYDVKSVRTIDFDRNEVKKKIKKLTKKCDEISTELDKIMIMTEVKVEPRFDFIDTLEDIIEKVKEQNI